MPKPQVSKNNTSLSNRGADWGSYLSPLLKRGLQNIRLLELIRFCQAPDPQAMSSRPEFCNSIMLVDVDQIKVCGNSERNVQMEAVGHICVYRLADLAVE